MKILLIVFIIWLIFALIANALLWLEDVSKSRWQGMVRRYKALPSEENKRALADSAAEYIKVRNASYFWWFWPITIPITAVVLIIRAPKAIYKHFKGSTGIYAQARKHMDGEVK